MKIQIYNPSNNKIEDVEKVVKSDEEWQKILTPEQFQVLRLKGTEQPFSKTCPLPPAKVGVYGCAACDTPLFRFETKFESKTGWPSFYQPISDLNIRYKTDESYGMIRTEVLCARCEGHLGHVFNDGPPPTYKRFCINTIALLCRQKGKY